VSPITCLPPRDATRSGRTTAPLLPAGNPTLRLAPGCGVTRAPAIWEDFAAPQVKSGDRLRMAAVAPRRARRASAPRQNPMHQCQCIAARGRGRLTPRSPLSGRRVNAVKSPCTSADAPRVGGTSPPHPVLSPFGGEGGARKTPCTRTPRRQRRRGAGRVVSLPSQAEAHVPGPQDAPGGAPIAASAKAHAPVRAASAVPASSWPTQGGHPRVTAGIRGERHGWPAGACPRAGLRPDPGARP
jgi:hypothetical protein